MCIYIYIYVYLYTYVYMDVREVPRNGGSWTAFLVFFFRFFILSNPHFDRGSNPLPCDPLGFP